MKKLKHDDKKSVISSEQFEGKDNKDKTFLCSWCSCVLSRLIDSSGQNTSLYCSRCQMSFDPEYDNLRHESKITIPDRNQEPAAASIHYNMEGEVEIHHTVPLRGGFEALSRKGTIKFTSYNTTEKE